ncbi:MAG: SLBB domain-containing protein [Pyrinomonadaceae bacterium]
MKGKLFVFLGLFCLLVEPFSVISQAPVSSPTPEIKNEADLIHFGDLIDVDFAGTSEHDWRGSLKQDGMLEGLDQYSPISALCRSETDVAADIANAYSKTLRDPKVTVRIIDRSNRAVAQLDGAVKIPMRFRFQRSAKLGELIVAAGGFTDDASGEIVIVRPNDLNCTEKSPSGNGIKTLNISVSELLSGKEAANPVILSGDLVTVQKAVPIYVIGAVNNPRPIYARSGMSVTRAIATAGGLAKGAVEQKVTIFRREGAATTIMHIDLKKIKTGEIDDVELKAFDIIEVTFKGRAQRKYPPVIAAGSYGSRNSTDLPLRIIE